MTKQVFTKAFKLEAVRLLEAGKQPATAIDESAEVKRLKRERDRVTEERDIPKKAAAYLARDLS